MASSANKGSEQDALRELSGLTPELSRALLAWWEKHGRRDPEQKPWMFTADQTWPLPAEVLFPYGVWIAEVMLCSAAHVSGLVPMGVSEILVR